jgi:peptidoglycan/LPS O-acetylase OafA/YrhL
MTVTPDSVLALLALIVMLAPAARYIYRLVQRRRRRRRPRDVEVSRTHARRHVLTVAHGNNINA